VLLSRIDAEDNGTGTGYPPTADNGTMSTTIRRAGGRPTKKQADTINERLLDCARSTFARKGIAKASLEEIAVELGVSKHTIYRRYSSKPALLDAVVQRDLIRFHGALIQAATGSVDPLLALRNVALRYFLFGADPEYSAFYLSVVAEAVCSASLRENLAAWSRIALEPLQQAIVSVQATDAIVPGDAAEICSILVDLLEGANNRVRIGVSGSPDEIESLKLFENRWSIFLRAMTSARSSQCNP
jgi:AcrR family transcriptional regulator